MTTVNIPHKDPFTVTCLLQLKPTSCSFQSLLQQQHQLVLSILHRNLQDVLALIREPDTMLMHKSNVHETKPVLRGHLIKKKKGNISHSGMDIFENVGYTNNHLGHLTQLAAYTQGSHDSLSCSVNLCFYSQATHIPENTSGCSTSEI